MGIKILLKNAFLLKKVLDKLFFPLYIDNHSKSQTHREVGTESHGSFSEDSRVAWKGGLFFSGPPLGIIFAGVKLVDKGKPIARWGRKATGFEALEKGKLPGMVSRFFFFAFGSPVPNLKWQTKS